MTGYTRQSIFTNGDVIDDSLFNDEYNQIVSAFSETTGHKHDGTSAEGAYVPVISDTTNTDKVEIVTGGAKTTGTHQVTGLITADVGVTATTGDVTVSAGNVDVTGDVVVTGNITVTGTVDGKNIAEDIDAKAPLAGATFTGDVTVPNLITAGNVDGRNVSQDGSDLDAHIGSTGTSHGNATGAVAGFMSATDKSKLDGVESGATADQTAADIRGLGFFDTTNGGSGSGLDADTLDGVEGSSFLRSDAADTKTSGDLIFNDNVQAQFGTSGDFRVFHDSANNILAPYIGDIVVKDGGVTERFRIGRTSGNVTTTGNVSFVDNKSAIFGSGNDFFIYHDTTDNILAPYSGDLIVRDSGTTERFRVGRTTGNLDLTGNVLWPDNKSAIFGAGNDFFMYFDSANTILAPHSGDIVVKQAGVTERFRIGRTSGNVTCGTVNGVSIATLNTASHTHTSSNATNGWWKDPQTGIIIQWGTNNAQTTFSWPTTFPNAIYGGSATLNASNNDAENPRFETFSTTQGRIRYGATSQTHSTRWIAIGR